MRKFFVLLFLCLASVQTQSLVVLQYHHISNKTPFATSTAPELFEEHLTFLKENRFQVISVTKLDALMKTGGALPDKTIVITFDDGYRSIFTTAYPLLKKYSFPFTVFINTKVHDQKNVSYASWAELKEMSKNGATIANHTDSHPHLIRNYQKVNINAWHKNRFREITFAEERIKKMIGKSFKLFAYPYGEYDTSLVKNLGAEGFLAFTQLSGAVSKEGSRQLIPRFPMGGQFGAASEFPTKVYSLPFPQLRVQVRDGQGRVLHEPVLPLDVNAPELHLGTPLARYIQGFNCYASGEGRIDSKLHSSTLVAQATKPLPVGRSRYNCTAKAGSGRYYWYSQLFIRRNNDGSWYRE